MEGLRKYLERIGLYADAMLKWLVIGGLVGGVGGMVGALFHLGVSYATEVRLAHPWVCICCRRAVSSSRGCINYVNWRAGAPTPSSSRYTSARRCRCFWCR